MKTFLGAKYHLTFKVQEFPEGVAGRLARFTPEVVQLIKSAADGDVVLNCMMSSQIRDLLLAADVVTVSGQHDARRWRVRLDDVRELVVVPEALVLLTDAEVAARNAALALAEARRLSMEALYTAVSGMRYELAEAHAEREAVISNIREIILAQQNNKVPAKLCSKENFLLQLGDVSFRVDGSALVFWYEGLRCTYRKEGASTKYHSSLDEFSFDLPRIEIWVELARDKEYGLPVPKLYSWLAFPAQEWQRDVVHPHIATRVQPGASVARLEACLGTYAPLLEACERRFDIPGLLKLWREYLMTCSESGGWYPRSHPFMFLPADVRQMYCSCGAELQTHTCLNCGHSPTADEPGDPESCEDEEDVA